MSRNTALQKRNHKIRLRAKQIMAGRLAAPDIACHWCARPVVNVSLLYRRAGAGEVTVLRHMAFTIEWSEPDGEVRKERIATVDHVVPLGDRVLDRYEVNRPSNLVIACAQCNHERNALQDKQENADGRKRCPACSGIKHPAAPVCDDCNGGGQRLTYTLGRALHSAYGDAGLLDALQIQYCVHCDDLVDHSSESCPLPIVAG